MKIGRQLSLWGAAARVRNRRHHDDHLKGGRALDDPTYTEHFTHFQQRLTSAGGESHQTARLAEAAAIIAAHPALVVPPYSNIDAAALAHELRGTIRGEVRFDEGSRALYATDSSNYRQVPIGVVLPRDVEDAIAAVAICRRFSAPLLCRGGGTS